LSWSTQTLLDNISAHAPRVNGRILFCIIFHIIFVYTTVV
jgi:hypothetical protein